MIEQMQMAQAEAEEKMRKLIEERRAKNTGRNDFKLKDILTGNLPDKVIREIYRPEKQFERKRWTKKYMEDFFKKNLTRPNKEMDLPTYLQPFHLPENPRHTNELI